MSQPTTLMPTLRVALPRLTLTLVFVWLAVWLQTPRAAAQRPNAPGVTLAATRADGVTFNVTLPPLGLNYETHAGVGYHRLTLDGYGHIGEVGLPDLPQTVVRLALPAGAQATARLVSSTPRTIAGVTPLPAAERTLLAYDYNDAAAVPEFATTYALNRAAAPAQYPADIVSVSAPTWLRDFAVVEVTIRPLQANLARNTLTVHDNLTIAVDFARPTGAASAERSPRAESAAFDSLLRWQILNYDQAQAWRAVPDRALQTSLSPCLDSAAGRTNAYRLHITQDGIYRITPGALPGLPASVNINTLRVCYDDVEVPLYRAGSGAFDGSDYVLFYGRAIKTHDTQTNAYWLTYGSGNGLTVSSLNAAPAGGTPVTSYRAQIDLEKDGLYNPSVPLADPNDRFDHWFEAQFGFGSTLPTALSHSFNASNLTVGGTVSVSADVWGGAGDSGNHPFALRLNGAQVGASDSFSGSGLSGSRLTITRTVANSGLLVGSNTVEVRALPPTGGAAAHIVLLNWLRISYDRNLVAQNNRLAFSHPALGDFRFDTSGFSGDPLIFDVTDPNVPRLLTNGGGDDFQPPTTKTATSYYLLRPENALTPAAIVKDTPSTWRSPTNAADYIVITDPALVSAVQPLVAHRRAQGLTVQVVLVQDIFDEFGYGRYDTQALREFLYYAYTTWRGAGGNAPAPSYVLLAGDGSFDHRNVQGKNQGRNFVPVYLRSGVDSFLGEAAADNQYVALGDYPAYGTLPMMQLGRLPAASAAEMTAMVNKIIANDNAGAGAAWQRTHFFVSDNALQDTRRPPNAPPNQTCFVDPAAINPTFFQIVDNFIAGHVAGYGQMTERLFFARCHEANPQPHYAYDSIVDMPLRYADQINSGAALITYVGHAGITFWGDEGFISLDVLDFLNNQGKYPVLLPMACLEGQYHRFDLRWQNQDVPDGLSEALLKRPNAGAVASFAPTGLQVTTGHDLLLVGFYDTVLQAGERSLGAAVFGAKSNLRSGPAFFQDLHDTFMLLGDPAMTLQLPETGGFNLYLPIARKAP